MAEIQQEIETVRAELAATVDELASRLDPRSQATKIITDATNPDASPEARRRARIVLGVAGAAAALVVAGLVRKAVRR